jgi:rod shape-determining protein MreC
LYPQKSYQDLIVLALLVILSIGIFTFHFREGENGLLHGLQRFTMNVMAPLQTGISVVISPFENLFRLIGESRDFRSENRKLKKDLAETQRQLVTFKDIEKENARLRKLVSLREKVAFDTLAARVIGRQSTEWQNNIVIDMGSNDGIKKHMPVLVSEGLVGQVVEVSSGAALVQLLNDEKSGEAAQIVETGEEGIVQGQEGGGLRLNFIAKSSPVKVGDSVITSGIGGVFPRGILIGNVKDVKDDPYLMYKTIVIEPGINTDLLEEVLVIIDMESPAPFLQEGKNQ